MSLVAPLLQPAMSVAAAPVPMVSVRGLDKAFARRRTLREIVRQPLGGERLHSLRDVSFTVGEGEFFGLLGPNGAGKSTLFRILSTLLIPDAGTARVNGFDVVREPADVRHVLTPVLTGERSLLWRLSARENLRIFTALHGVPRREERLRVEEALATVGLVDTGEKMVGDFSAGMRQRLLIARALLARPRVLLLDEPTRSLDPIAAREFRHFLRDELQQRRRCTILLATHSAEEALELCERVGVLDRGRLLAVGTTAELSQAVGDERYRVLTSAPEHAAFGELASAGSLRRLERLGETAPGWHVVEIEVPGGPPACARVLEALHARGVPVATFQPVPLTLASLIERVVARFGGE